MIMHSDVLKYYVFENIMENLAFAPNGANAWFPQYFPFSHNSSKSIQNLT